MQTYELGGRLVALSFAKTWDGSPPSTELNVIMPWSSVRAVEAVRDGEVQQVADDREAVAGADVRAPGSARGLAVRRRALDAPRGRGRGDALRVFAAVLNEDPNDATAFFAWAGVPRRFLRVFTRCLRVFGDLGPH